MSEPLTDRARAGDRAAFDTLATQAERRLRAVVGRLVHHPEDRDELVQEALARAWKGMPTFRGKAAFSTWLCAIGASVAKDHLRARPWRPEAQVLHAVSCQSDPTRAGALYAAANQPHAAFDAREHIAFCFGCIGRSLPPEEHEAVVLRDVLGLGNTEAGEVAGVSTSVLRHRLARGRATMTARFESLCALVNKQGACWQCEGLRQLVPEDRRGPPPADLAGETGEARYRARLAVVRAADPTDGVTGSLHAEQCRQLEAHEAAGEGDASAMAEACRPS